MSNIFLGLPRRTVFCHIENKPREINVTTDVVGELIAPYVEGDINNDFAQTIRKFDETVMFFVPIPVFSFDDDKAIVNYIHKHIDSNVTNPKQY
jgi:hypothetical protein